MIPQHSHVSLLVYLTCLGFVSPPVQAFSQVPPLSSQSGVGTVSESWVGLGPAYPLGSLAQLSPANPNPTQPGNSSASPPAPLNLPPNNAGSVSPTPVTPGQTAPTTQSGAPNPNKSQIWFFGLLGLAVGSVLGGSLFYLTRRSSQTPVANGKATPSSRVLQPSSTQSFPQQPLKASSQPLSVQPQQNGHHSFAPEISTPSPHASGSGSDGERPKAPRSSSGTKASSDVHGDELDLAVGDASPIAQPTKASHSTYQEPAFEETTRLAKVSIVDELISDLQSPDRGQRSKAIWELGQRGDSQAVQPLVDLMIDSDSKQRSLILAALSEIGVRTLKPMNRALAISLQDDNPEVRKNAIRDLTRIYDMVSQISQLLRHATEDPDEEVQETARWALNQVGRIRTAAGLDGPTLPGGANAQDQLPGS